MKKAAKKQKKRPVKLRKKSPGRGKAAGTPGGVKKLTEFERYAFFVALPTPERQEAFGFHTDSDFAEANKVNRDTLTDWRLKPEFWEARDKYMGSFRRFTADVLGALARRTISKGYAFEAQTWMKIVEGWNEKSTLDLTSKGRQIKGFEFVLRNPNANTSANNQPGGEAGN